MNFEVLPLSDIWLDFTRFSPIEEAICTVENILAKWSNKQVYTLEKSRFGFQSKYYFLNYVPKKYSESSSIKEQLIKFPSNSIDLIRSIFGIDSPFVYVTNAEDNNKITHTLLSIIRPAAQATKFNIPILIQISDKHAIYVGFKLDEKTETFYSSQDSFNLKSSQKIKSFESLDVVQKIYKESMSSIYKSKEIRNQSTSFQINLKITENSVVGKENAHYQSSKFYAFMPNDPIQYFYVMCNFNDLIINELVENKNDFFNILNATDICISIERIISVYKKSNTKFFMENMKKCTNENSWKQLLVKGPNQSAKTLVAELFAKFEKQDVENSEDADYLTKKTILKASPEHSLLSGITELLMDTSDLPTISLIWLEFVKELRRRTDHHEYIPGVGKNGPDLDHCIYYQKLEMLNLCIKCMIGKNEDSKETNNSTEKKTISNKNTKFLLDGSPMIYPETEEAPVRTEDQILESVQLLQQNMDDQRQKAILQSGQLKSDMSAFKKANPTAKFEDFVYWYSPSDFNPETKKLSTRMSEEDNVWKELWSNARSDIAEKSLFDPVAQSEYVLDFFESLIPFEVFGDLIFVALATIYFDVKEITKNISTIYTVKKSLDVIEEQIMRFHTEVENIQGTLPPETYMNLCLDIFEIIAEAMLPIHCAKSLMLKFSNNIIITNQLLEYGIHYISTIDERNLLNSFLEIVGIDSKSGKLPPQEFIRDKQYIMNGFIEEKGEKLQQRLYVSDFQESFVVGTTMQEKKSV